MPDQLPQLLNIKQMAEILDCKEDAAAARLNNGDLPGVKIGRGWIVPAEAFFARLNELALEEAEKRREARKGQQPQAPAKITPLTCMAVASTTTGKRGRTRRELPDLSKYLQGQQAA